MKFRLLKERLNKTESVNKPRFPLLMESKEDQERFAIFLNDEKLADEFFKRKKNFPYPQNDYVYWMKNKTPQDVQDYLQSADKNSRFWKEVNDFIKEDGADDVELIAHKDGYKIYRIDSYQAAVKYGLVVGGFAQWCVAGAFYDVDNDDSLFHEVDDYWGRELDWGDGAQLYYVIADSSTKSSPKKFAITVNLIGNDQDTVIYDKDDKQVPEIPGLSKTYDGDLLIYDSFEKDSRKGDFVIEPIEHILEEYLGSDEIVKIPYGVQEIENHAFRNADKLKIKKVTVPNSCKYLDGFAFYGLYEMEEIYLPKSIIKIGIGCFSECVSLKNIYYNGTQEQWDNINIQDRSRGFSNAEVKFNSKNEGLNRNMRNRKLKESYDYFETKDAIYKTYNGKHMYHMKEWDNIPSFKYHWEEIPMGKYIRAYRAEAINESFDKKDFIVTTVDWTNLQNIVNRILEKSGKDFYIGFRSANNRYLSSPYDMFISVYESETGEVIDDEKLSARYYPGADAIFVSGGLERKKLTSPEEVAENISETVEYWYREWSR